MRIEQYGHPGPGYKPILLREGWQIGHLNFAPEFSAEAIDRVECHRKTDEVFILLRGGASLIEARETSAGLGWEVVRMRPGVTYNVPAALWHTIAMLPGDLVLIVEKDGTHLNDVEYRSLTEREQGSLQQAISMKRD